MMAQGRRAAIKARKRTYRPMDKTPIELPATTRTIPSTRDMVRASVQEALAQAGADHGYESAEAMIQEETDLDQIDPDPPWTSNYEVTEMEDETMAPIEDSAPPQEGEPNKDATSSEQQAEIDEAAID